MKHFLFIYGKETNTFARSLCCHSIFLFFLDFATHFFIKKPNHPRSKKMRN